MDHSSPLLLLVEKKDKSYFLGQRVWIFFPHMKNLDAKKTCDMEVILVELADFANVSQSKKGADVS